MGINQVVNEMGAQRERATSRERKSMQSEETASRDKWSITAEEAEQQENNSTAESAWTQLVPALEGKGRPNVEEKGDGR
jgi:cytoskeletal protein RodZ